MKHIIILSLAILSLISCTQSDPGRENAEKYIREILSGQDISTITVMDPDTIVSDLAATMAYSEALRYYQQFLCDSITPTRTQYILDSISTRLQDIHNSILTGTPTTLPSDTAFYRLSYPVVVTMQSSHVSTYYVIMDNDGTTPRCLQEEAINRILDYQNSLSLLH